MTKKAKKKQNYILVKFDDGEFEGVELFTELQWQSVVEQLAKADWPQDVEMGNGSEDGYLTIFSYDDYMEDIEVEDITDIEAKYFKRFHPTGGYGDFPHICDPKE